MKEEKFEQVFNTANLYEIFEKKILPKPSIGIDGSNIETFSKTALKTLSIASKKILSEKFEFSPYLEELKIKGKNKTPRVISKPTNRDRIILAGLLSILQEEYSESVKRELPNQIIRKIKEEISKAKKDLSYVKIDVTAFYDNINHRKLLKKLEKKLDPKTLTLTSKAIKNITVTHTTKKNEYPSSNKIGVPQGLCISNILSDIYLNKIDKKYSTHTYNRFVDDILIISENKTLETSENIKHDLKKLKLETNDKSSEGKISQGMEYLGYLFHGKNLVSVRNSSKERFIRSLIATITRYKNTKNNPNAKHWLTDEARVTILIETLNEKITGAISEKKRYGWIFYFIEINDMKLLHEIDSIVRKNFCKAGLKSHLPRLKRLSRAYHEAKHNTHGNYIHNYNKYNTLQEKINYLITMGIIDPDGQHSYAAEHIEKAFEIKKQKNLLQLEVDLGSFS